ncbi:MAG: M15 family metallopeptidase [Actinomycetes bacterium]
MSEAYAKQTGQPLCITDSYRDLASQIAVRAAKPTLAAVPGTSNHGWGTAVDMCGGVQTFGSPAHQWMRANAPMYGFFHPGWAQANGSKPEPWHWEYGR